MWDGYKRTKKKEAMLDFAKSKNMKIEDLHTSGHASIDTIERIIGLSKAKRIIPVHTENSKLFAEKFSNVDIGVDGEIIRV